MKFLFFLIVLSIFSSTIFSKDCNDFDLSHFPRGSKYIINGTSGRGSVEVLFFLWSDARSVSTYNCESTDEGLLISKPDDYLGILNINDSQSYQITSLLYLIYEGELSLLFNFKEGDETLFKGILLDRHVLIDSADRSYLNKYYFTYESERKTWSSY